jgi:hypothetical protein
MRLTVLIVIGAVVLVMARGLWYSHYSGVDLQIMVAEGKIGYLRSATSDPEYKRRIRLVDAICASWRPSYSELLGVLSRDPQSLVRAAVAEDIKRFGLREEMAVLEDLRTDPEELVREAAADAMRSMGTGNTTDQSE